MDLKKSLQEEIDDYDEEHAEDVYSGRVLQCEDPADGFKVRYANDKTETKTFNRYFTTMCNLIPVRSLQSSKLSYPKRVDAAGLFSVVTYSWIFPYLWDAWRGRTKTGEKWQCSMYDSSAVNSIRIEYLWKRELERNPSQPSLFRVVWQFVKTRILIANFIFFLCTIFGFIGPTCFVHGIIAFAENPSVDDKVNYRHGLTLVVCILLVEIARTLFYSATWYVGYRTGIRLRGALLTLLYKRLIYAKSYGKRTSAEIINIFANDGQRLFDAIAFTPLVMIGPTVLIGGIIYLLICIGPWSLLGIIVYLVFDMFQFALGKFMMKIRANAVVATEKRVSLTGEIIHCIRIIKMNSWEDTFKAMVEDMRNEEKILLKEAGYAQSLAIASGSIVPAVAAVFTFTGFVLSGGNLLASDAFSVVTVFFVMVYGLRMIPYGSRYCAEAYVGLQRIKNVLLIPEFDETLPLTDHPSHAVQFKNVVLNWDIDSPLLDETENSPTIATCHENQTALNDLNLTIQAREFIGICGPVGSGKTALLNSIAGHMVVKEGSLSVWSGVAYVTQVPWIENLSIRDNILFGMPMNSNLYYRVIKACELTKDLETMEAGDQTEIGEKGAALSGGQKARISLARSVYANKQIYLLDNIFASLDCKVAESVLQKCLRELLGKKTVLLVTDSIEHLSACDKVIFVNDKRVLGFDNHKILLKTCDAYSVFIDHLLDFRGKASSSLVEISTYDSCTVEDSGDKSSLVLPEVSTTSQGVLVDSEENLGTAAVKWSVYRAYINAAGGSLVWIVLILIFIFNVVSMVFSTAWLSQWLKYGHLPENGTSNNTSSLADSDSLSFYASLYGASVLLLFASGILKALVFVNVTLSAASNLHRKMLCRVLSAKVEFFDSTPRGRILNRFSTDIDEVDIKLPFTIEVFLQNMLYCLAFMVMIAWVFPAFLLACIPLFVIFVFCVSCFRAGITSLKRSENISRSPLFSHIAGSMDGLITIHSLDQTERYIETFKSYMDFNGGSIFMYQSALRWIAVWLDLFVVAVTTLVSLLIVITTGTVAPADAGMALAFAIQMTGILQFAVRTQTELESKMTSVERIVHYSENIDEEKQSELAINPSVPYDWPKHGKIELKNLMLSYRNRPPALNGITLLVKPEEKIGIVGRTGSGKTSLCNSLFQLYKTEGRIEIDEFDLKEVELHRLRRAIAVIPQDPTLFTGTFRFNLDPTSECTDDQLWNALEKTYLKDMVSSLDEKLNSIICEGGRNLSVGERQLVCMARASLRRAKIVIMDEATSNVDLITDRLIRTCLHEAFSKSTVLLIAHRLESVMDMDKILFMDNGKCVEFDAVGRLLRNKESNFCRLLGEKRANEFLSCKESRVENAPSEEGETTSSSPVNLCLLSSDKNSPETSEFEKIGESIERAANNTSDDVSDLEVIDEETVNML